MYRPFVVIAAALVLSWTASAALAQCGCGATTVYTPVAPSYTAYYAPAVTYYAPTPAVTYYAPVTPQVTYYAPVTPQVTYYTPYTTYYAPVVPPYRGYYYGVPRSRLFW